MLGDPMLKVNYINTGYKNEYNERKQNGQNHKPSNISNLQCQKASQQLLQHNMSYIQKIQRKRNEDIQNLQHVLNIESQVKKFQIQIP